MERCKRLLKKAFCLPPLPGLALSIPLFALLIFVFAAGVTGPPAYLAYLGSAYALTVCVTGAVRLCGDVRRRIEGTRLGGRYLHEAAFRARVSLCFGFAVNLAYIAVKLCCGVYFRSAWFLALAVYYILLALMRLMLLRCMGRGAAMDAQWRRCRLCGVVLLLMNQALAGIVVFIVHQNRSFEYPGFLIYAMAFYAFYAVISAAVNLVKYRRYGSPAMSAAKAVSLAAALTSILSLTTALLERFGGADGPAFREAMTAAVGGGVCTIVIGMAVFMIWKSTRRLGRLGIDCEQVPRRKE